MLGAGERHARRLAAGRAHGNDVHHDKPRITSVRVQYGPSYAPWADRAAAQAASRHGESSCVAHHPLREQARDTMLVRWLLAAALWSALSANGAIAAPPANDMFPGATLGSDEVLGTTVEA